MLHHLFDGVGIYLALLEGGVEDVGVKLVVLINDSPPTVGFLHGFPHPQERSPCSMDQVLSNLHLVSFLVLHMLVVLVQRLIIEKLLRESLSDLL